MNATAAPVIEAIGSAGLEHQPITLKQALAAYIIKKSNLTDKHAAMELMLSDVKTETVIFRIDPHLYAKAQVRARKSEMRMSVAFDNWFEWYANGVPMDWDDEVIASMESMQAKDKIFFASDQEAFEQLVSNRIAMFESGRSKVLNLPSSIDEKMPTETRAMRVSPLAYAKASARARVEGITLTAAVKRWLQSYANNEALTTVF